MFDRLLAFLSTPPAAAPSATGTPFPRRQVAVVALLVELAQSDRSVGTAELATVERIVRERFGLDAGSASRLIASARRELDASLEDWVFANAVREGFPEEERLGVVELLWEVVYADGRLARLEESLMRRLSAQLGVGEPEREAARAEAFARSEREAGREPGAAEAE